jgi:hypothetical protein
VETDRRTIPVLAAFVLISCGTPPPAPDMNSIAERYVKLALLAGQHDTDFVDAYYGDPSWTPTGPAVPIETLVSQAGALRGELAVLTLPPDAEDVVRLRAVYLDKQLVAVQTRLSMLTGVRLPFDAESL